ncbi:Spy/CpxP family protein refolding chaperone [Sulfuriflexus sp.]|uniref:Spy/CpxP family protein refolding chaperone n=1 Tax=Sulfuriflexus sp. TaxID=2015443 RepID=UPI0028CE56BA|nr:Spy/CpxP family protein refolding chaperone [Sulfuriflexus sp.]MDT8403807.1 Spy/CpxP family protein refolding chaperone [Sulfuriflexus sp.]
MKTIKHTLLPKFILLGLLCLPVTQAAYAQQGMMSERGGMMYDDDSRRMRGYGMGMMDGSGMGMGMGMMDGSGMGMGHMGMGPSLWQLDLNDKQREQAWQIMRETRDKQWELMKKAQDSGVDMSKLYSNPTPEPDKVGKAYSTMTDLQRQMLENHVEAQNRIYQLLNEEQRKQLQEKRSYNYRDNR